MTRSILVFAVLLGACDSRAKQDHSEHQPFRAPDWNAVSLEDEIIAAIVGSGGSAEERQETESLARTVFLPYVREPGNDPASLRWGYETLLIKYASVKEDSALEAVVRTAIRCEVGRISPIAARLAAARLWHELFPNEPFPEDWEKAAAVDVSTLPFEAITLDARMRELEARYGERLPQLFQWDELLPSQFHNWGYGEYQMIQIARLDLYIAITGDFRLTSGGFYDRLSARGVRTIYPAYDRPF